MRSLVSLCASCLLAGAAWAQQDNPQNPHSTQNPSRPTSNAPQSTTNQQQQGAEQGNPHSVDNANRPALPDANPNDILAGELENPEATQPPVTDPKVILQRMHIANLLEIQMAQMAEQNATDKVKDFARTVEADQKAADQKVVALAKQKNITLTDKPAMKPEVAQKHEAMMEKMQNMKGEDFDRVYTGMMMKGHKRMMTSARQSETACKDKDVVLLIGEMMPTMQKHEQMAEKLHGSMPQGRAPESAPR
jgi:putative membrane protein